MHRQCVCLCRNLGMTKIYNLFNNPASADADIAELRHLHGAMDTAVAFAYGWQDLDLRHDFYGDGKDCRFTLHPDAKSEVLRRLLKLNHERYAEEVAAGLHEKGKSKARVARPPRSVDVLSGGRRDLFDDQLTLGEGE